MNAPQNLVILGLALATVAAGAFGWQQYQRAERLDAMANQARHERQQLRRELQGVEQEREPVLAEAGASAASDLPASIRAEEAEAPGGPGGPEPGESRMNSLMNDPQFVAAMQAQQRARLDGRYADLFRKLNLPPAQVDELKALLAERQTARMDVMAAARSEGLNGRDNREELRMLMEQTEAEIDAGIRDLLGDSGFAQYQQYEQTAPQRAVVNQLETRLSYSSVPLTRAQSDALVNLLAEAIPAAGNGNGPRYRAGPGGPAAFAGGLAPITDQVIQRAQGVLAPAQVEALREIQDQQAAQRQVAELMRQRSSRGPAPLPPPEGR